MVGRTFKVNCDSQTLNNSKSYGFIEDQSVWTRWKLPIIGTLRFNPIVSFFSIILIWIFVAVCIVYKENVPFTIWKAAIGQKLVLFPNSQTLSLWGLSQPETLHTTCRQNYKFQKCGAMDLHSLTLKWRVIFRENWKKNLNCVIHLWFVWWIAKPIQPKFTEVGPDCCRQIVNNSKYIYFFME